METADRHPELRNSDTQIAGVCSGCEATAPLVEGREYGRHTLCVDCFDLAQAEDVFEFSYGQACDGGMWGHGFDGTESGMRIIIDEGPKAPVNDGGPMTPWAA